MVRATAITKNNPRDLRLVTAGQGVSLIGDSITQLALPIMAVDLLGADSLAYVSLEGVYGAIEGDSATHCDACFSGNYPLPVAAEGNKLAFESELPMAPTSA